MATTFQFIDHSLIDRKSRRTIRSHVMKGKNVGKVRTPRRPPHGTEKTNLYNVNGHDAAAPSISPETGYDQPLVCPKLMARFGNELSGLSSACEMTPQARHFVHDCEFNPAP